MNQKFSNILLSIMTITILVLTGYIISISGNSKNTEFTPVVMDDISSTTPQSVESTVSQSNQNSNTATKTFVFDNFHGSNNISLKFSLEYPANWNNDGQYFSPQKIEYYDAYSVKAPFYFDLILSSIYDQTDFKYQIDHSKRKSPDTHGKINGQEFKRYDLIDYGSYGGDSAGRVIIYVGPKIVINGLDYILVFHWEEKPLTETISGNDPAVFEKAVLSLKFAK